MIRGVGFRLTPGRSGRTSGQAAFGGLRVRRRLAAAVGGETRLCEGRAGDEGKKPPNHYFVEPPSHVVSCIRGEQFPSRVKPPPLKWDVRRKFSAQKSARSGSSSRSRSAAHPGPGRAPPGRAPIFSADPRRLCGDLANYRCRVRIIFDVELGERGETNAAPKPATLICLISRAQT
jgi:hypothetical protein